MSYYRIVESLASDDYHADLKHVSKSWLDKIAKCPALLKYYLECGNTNTSRSLSFGNDFHEYTLEPDLFFKSFFFNDSENFFDLDLDNLSAPPRQILNQKVTNQFKGMKEALMNDRIASKLLSGGRAEVSVFFEDSNGIRCKARADYLRPDIIVDLKTCESADPKLFNHSVGKYRYHVQHAHYTEGFKCDDFAFIAIEKKPPYLISVNVLSKDSIRRGRELRQRDILLYRDCLTSGHWPGYSEHINDLSLPKRFFYD